MNDHESSRLLPTRDTVRLLAAPALVFISSCVDRGYQTDYWPHLARGREIIAAGRVVDVDLFTYTAGGRPMVDGNWLSQVIFYGLHQLGGLPLVQFLNAIVLATAFWILVRTCRRVSDSTGLAAAAGIVALLGSCQALIIRPQSFSILLFTILFAVLLHLRETARRWQLAIPPFIACLWANLHGGFAIGLLLIGAFTATAVIEAVAIRMCANRDAATLKLRSAHAAGMVACLLASISTTLVNPFGWRIYTYAAGLSRICLERGVQEWLPPSLNLWIGWAFFVSIVVVGAMLLAARRPPRVLHGVLLVCFLPPALLAVRMVVWWFLIVAPILATIAADLSSNRKAASAPRKMSRPTAGAALCVTALLAACAISIPWLERISPVFALRSSHRMEETLDEVSGLLNQAGGSGFSPRRIFCRMEWGSYFCWAAHPNYRVFMEAHVELYDDSIWREYRNVIDSRPDWQEQIDARGVEVMIVDDVNHAKLLASARTSGNWDRVMQRPGVTVLVRAGSKVADALHLRSGRNTYSDAPQGTMSDSVSADTAQISPDGR